MRLLPDSCCAARSCTMASAAACCVKPGKLHHTRLGHIWRGGRGDFAQTEPRICGLTKTGAGVMDFVDQLCHGLVIAIKRWHPPPPKPHTRHRMNLVPLSCTYSHMWGLQRCDLLQCYRIKATHSWADGCYKFPPSQSSLLPQGRLPHSQSFQRRIQLKKSFAVTLHKSSVVTVRKQEAVCAAVECHVCGRYKEKKSSNLQPEDFR